jgi:hypothetical protein
MSDLYDLASRRRHHANRRWRDILAMMAAVIVAVVVWSSLHGAAGGVHAGPNSISVYYRNCDAARAAGAAPMLRGEPGYRPGLDADSDGIACEPWPR